MFVCFFDFIFLLGGGQGHKQGIRIGNFLLPQFQSRGSTIGLAGCGIWLILRAGSGMRVKNRGGKRDFKYKRERDNAFLRGSGCGNHQV